MSAGAARNEGICVVGEFAFEADSEPAVGLVIQSPSGVEREWLLLVSELLLVSAGLVSKHGQLEQQVEVGAGVTCTPHYRLLSPSGYEVSSFRVCVPASAQPDAAAALSDWMVKLGVGRVRANGVGVSLADSSTRVAQQLAKWLN